MKNKLFSRMIVVVLIVGVIFYFYRGNSKSKNDYAVIQSVSGEVSKIDEFTSNTIKVKNGDTILQNEIIQTGSASSALIVVGKGYDLKIRLGEKSSLKISELMKYSINNQETSIFNLIRGQIITLLNNNNKKANVQIRTRHMAMGIRGTLFSVISDGQNGTFLGVKHGEVSSVNLITNKESIVSANSVLTTMENGQQSNKTELMEKINWDLNSDSNIGIDLKDFLNSVSNTNNYTDSHSSLNEVIIKAEKFIEGYENEITRNNQKIAELLDVISERTAEANKDIDCLSKSSVRCKLVTEKILLNRGFPIEYGNKKYTNLMIEELNKYKNELNKEIDELKESNKDIQRTIQSKNELIKQAKDVISNNSTSEEAKNEMIKKLQEEI